MKTHFIITRRTHWWMNLFPLTVYLDGIEIGTLQNHEFIEYDLVQREQYVHVAVQSWGFFKKKHDFHLKATDRMEIQLVSGWDNFLRILAFIFALLLFHFTTSFKNDKKVELFFASLFLLYQLIGYGAVSFIQFHFDRSLLVRDIQIAHG